MSIKAGVLLSSVLGNVLAVPLLHQRGDAGATMGHGGSSPNDEERGGILDLIQIAVGIVASLLMFSESFSLRHLCWEVVSVQD